MASNSKKSCFQKDLQSTDYGSDDEAFLFDLTPPKKIPSSDLEEDKDRLHKRRNVVMQGYSSHFTFVLGSESPKSSDSEEIDSRAVCKKPWGLPESHKELEEALRHMWLDVEKSGTGAPKPEYMTQKLYDECVRWGSLRPNVARRFSLMNVDTLDTKGNDQDENGTNSKSLGCNSNPGKSYNSGRGKASMKEEPVVKITPFVRPKYQ